MAVGTAGFTSMLSVMALEDHGIKDGPVLVTGAAGGVGSVADAILAALGMRLRRYGPSRNGGLSEVLGATQIVAREELNETVKRPMEGETWGGCVDAVGGEMLARVLGQMKYGASVALLVLLAVRLASDGYSVLAARREPVGYRFRHAALRKPGPRMGADRQRSSDGQAGGDGAPRDLV